MSWRLLVFTLLVLAGAATVGGLYAGDWLVSHAPKQTNLPNVSANDPAPLVDETGLPIMRRPAQPLMNGMMGVPSNKVNVSWKVKADNLTTAETASIDNDIEMTEGSVSQSIRTRPIVDRSSNTLSPPANNHNWEAVFQQELAQCRQLGFFERASCVGRVRENHCELHKAWGNVKDCPAR